MNKAGRKDNPKRIGKDDIICPGCGGPMFERVVPSLRGEPPARKCPFCKTVWEIEEKR